jgi:cytochrome c556
VQYGLRMEHAAAPSRLVGPRALGSTLVVRAAGGLARRADRTIARGKSFVACVTPPTARRGSCAPGRVAALLGALVVGPTLLAALGGCAEPSGSPSASSPRAATATATASVAPEARWLVDVEGDAARFARVAKHLRGLDVAMVEIGHRYAELHWATRDQNFDYATYQLGKIDTALGQGVERRPRRAASARAFDAVLGDMRAALGRRDQAEVTRAFEALTAACNTCHVAERVPFIHVGPPSVRASVVQTPARATP